jgi:hypothetical protein
MGEKQFCQASGTAVTKNGMPDTQCSPEVNPVRHAVVLNVVPRSRLVVKLQD